MSTTNKDLSESEQVGALEAIVGRYVRLKHHKNTYSGLCPFHKGTKPSLIIWPVPQVFSCRVPGCIANAQERKQQLKASDFIKLVNEYHIVPLNEQIPLFPQEKVTIRRISFSMLEAYQLCPLNFKNEYITKKHIQKSTFNRQFGLAIHGTLRDFYRINLNERNLFNLNILLHKNWKVKNDEDSYWLERAQEMLQPFAENPIPYMILTERYFNYKIEDLALFGYIDRIDKVSANFYEVIDYKTLKNEPNTELEAANLLQSTFLYFGAYSIFTEYPSRITYLHVQDNKSVSFVPNHQIMQKNLLMIGTMVDEIYRTEEFMARKNEYCSACKLLGICSATK